MSIQQMNVHDCVRCGNPINYDDTDWCDVCDMSIFDDRMVKTKKMLTIENINSLVGNYLFRWRIDSVEIITPKDIDKSYYHITLHKQSAEYLAYIRINRKVNQLYSKFVFATLHYGTEVVEEDTFTLEQLSDKVVFLSHRIDKLNEYINFQ